MGLVAYLSYFMVLVNEEDYSENFFSFFLGSMLHIKYLRGNVPTMVGIVLSDAAVRIVDKGWLEKIGPQGAGEVLGGQFGRYNQRVQSGQFFQVVLACLGVSCRVVF